MTITKAYTDDAITVTDSATGINEQSGQFNVVAGSLDHFAFTTINTVTAGTAFSITITAEDSSGNPVTNYAGSVSFTDSTGTIYLVSSGVFVNGVWTGSVIITKAITSDVITAIDTVTGVTGKSNTFTVTAAPATQLSTLQGQPNQLLLAQFLQ